MKQVWRREILIEKEQIAVLSKKANVNFPLCEICRDKQLMIPPSLIAEILQISTREIYRRVESENIHIKEDDLFQMFICSHSLSQSLKKQNKVLH